MGLFWGASQEESLIFFLDVYRKSFFIWLGNVEPFLANFFYILYFLGAFQ